MGTIETVAASTLALPTSGNPDDWSDDEKALLAAAGLTFKAKDKSLQWAPRPTVVAFLRHCERTGLDPIARQIYAIKRGDDWGIQVSIDGFRLVADRSRLYAGQLPIEWTADGVTWTDVWLGDDPPAAARATVLRKDFSEPMVAVARYSSYVVMNDEWAGPSGSRTKTGKQIPGPMWARMPEVMIGKVAEALALRKAFPQELSGLYTEDEMGGAVGTVVVEEPTPASQRSRVQRPSDASAAPDGPDTPDADADSPTGGVASSAGDSEAVADAVDLVECARCGTATAGIEPGMICPDCESEVEAEIAAEQEGGR